MDQNFENTWDQILKVKTGGRDDSNADTYRYPYEPTPYVVLERLAKSEYIGKKNTLLDYGSGKGRVDFFMSYQTKCHSIGVEYDDRIFNRAMENLRAGAATGRCEFVCEDAVEFKVPEQVDRCYFFNPFSEEILRKVLARIKESYYKNPRVILLFFYYPSEEYVSTLMTDPELSFLDEIDCRDLFPGNEDRECLLVFEVG